MTLNRTKVAKDIWDILCKVYNIDPLASQSEKQVQLINTIVEYLDNSSSARPKAKEKKCLTK